jgi:ribonuclease HII
MLILGIDDSGRGPLIGPMIMAGCLIDSELEKEFKEHGVKDSKKLTDKRREILAEIVKTKALSYNIIVISPREIDGRTNAGINLNRIEAIKSADIINSTNKGFDKIKVVVDCPSPNIEKWTRTLKSYVDKKDNLEFVVEHKADVNHIACSAASIIAKSQREKEVRKIKRAIGKDFGSGYPSDPVTCKFLKDYAKEHRKDGIFRETWATWKNNCITKEQKKLGEF